MTEEASNDRLLDTYFLSGIISSLEVILQEVRSSRRHRNFGGVNARIPLIFPIRRFAERQVHAPAVSIEKASPPPSVRAFPFVSE